MVWPGWLDNVYMRTMRLTLKGTKSLWASAPASAHAPIPMINTIWHLNYTNEYRWQTTCNIQTKSSVCHPPLLVDKKTIIKNIKGPFAGFVLLSDLADVTLSCVSQCSRIPQIIGTADFPIDSITPEKISFWHLLLQIWKAEGLIKFCVYDGDTMIITLILKETSPCVAAEPRCSSRWPTAVRQWASKGGSFT